MTETKARSSMGRFSDFASGAGAEFGWSPGSIKEAFEHKQQEISHDVIDNSLVASAIKDNLEELITLTHAEHFPLVEHNLNSSPFWVGTAAQLKEDLDSIDPRVHMHVQSNPRAIRTEVARMIGVLGKHGIQIEMPEGKKGPSRLRLIIVRNVASDRD